MPAVGKPVMPSESVIALITGALYDVYGSVLAWPSSTTVHARFRPPPGGTSHVSAVCGVVTLQLMSVYVHVANTPGVVVVHVAV